MVRGLKAGNGKERNTLWRIKGSRAGRETLVKLSFHVEIAWKFGMVAHEFPVLENRQTQQDSGQLGLQSKF